MKDKRILVLSFFYPPDLSAGSFRTVALVEALLEEPSSQVKIDVITTLPHRYSSFRSQAPAQENDERRNICRIELPSHRHGMLDQARAFAHFWREASKLAGGQQYDLVFATSGRLMTAALGAWISRQGNTQLYLDIRDIFVDTIKEVLPTKMALVLKPLFSVFSVIERWTINRAAHVNLVSRGFAPYFTARYPRKSFSYFTNGVDEQFLLHRDASGSGDRKSEQVRVLYAGNMGEGQALDSIIPAIARRLSGRATFRLIGDGGRRQRLETALAELGVANVEVVAPMPRASLILEYLAADVLFLHLNDYDVFKTVLPSKIFEYAALGKPVWAGVSGYAAQFLHEEVSNVAVFPPCDAEQALTVFEQLDIRDAPREAFVHKFSRKVIMRAMAADVLGRVGQDTVS